MNILFYLTRYPGIGGIESVTTIIATALQKNGHNLIILSHLKGCDVSEKIPFDVLYMPNEKSWVNHENVRFAESLIERVHIDVVIYQDSYAPTEKIVVGLSKKYNIPLYVFEHNSPLYVYLKRDISSFFTLKGFLRRLLHPYLLLKERRRKRYLYFACKKYILLSKGFINDFKKVARLNTNTEKLLFISNPIIVSDLEKSYTYTQKENIILFVGRLELVKGVDKMLLFWNKLSKSLPSWRFIVVGDGSIRSELEKMVKDYRIERVSFDGFQNPNPYFNKAKIFWMCSKFEGFGMTLVEGMQYGCVPIAFNTFSALDDIIDDGINGYSIPKDNNALFIERTIQLTSEEHWCCMSSAAVEKAKDFNLNKIIPKWKTLLNEINLQ